MNWNQKEELIRLGNSKNLSEQSKKDFQDFVLSNLKNFDEYAWNMFITLIDINIDEMKNNIDFWKSIYDKLKDIEFDFSKHDFRFKMRMTILKTICKDDLKL